MAYVTADKVAEHFGVCKKTVYKWAREGRIPSYTIGRMKRFVIEEIETSGKREVQDVRM